MTEPDNHIIDDVFRQGLSAFEAVPPAHVFGRIKATIADQNILPARKNVKCGRLIYPAASLLVILTLLYYFWPVKRVDKQMIHQNTAVQELKTNKETVDTKVRIPEKNPKSSASPVTTLPEKANTEKSIAAYAGQDAVICGLSYTLNAHLTEPGSTGSWSCDDNGVIFYSGKIQHFPSSNNDPQAEVKVDHYGKYHFTWNEMAGSRHGTARVDISFIKAPEVSAGKDSQVCGNNAELKSTGNTGFWNLMSGLTYKNPNMPVTSVHADKPGKYRFVWTETSGICTARDSVNISFVPQPSSDISIVGPASCAGMPFTFAPVNPSGCKYKWDLDEGVITDRSGNNISVSWKYGNEHIVSLTATNKENCSSTSSLTVKEPPRLDVTFTNTYTDEQAPVVVYFMNKTSLGNTLLSDTKNVSFLWKFGDRQTSVESQPDHLYQSNGNYKVKLVATDLNGCRDSSSTILHLKGSDKSMMTVFTPNGDGDHDVFTVDASDIRNFKCVILTGSGEKIYEWTDPAGGWDGRLKNTGDIASQGLYYYMISGLDVNSKAVEIAGTVYLLRK
ncbi:MAG: PKD domain-containing protein [Bacteroidia bacterium]|nr:PKD domain-containing protein [Bacteroidia bacterium]